MASPLVSTTLVRAFVRAARARGVSERALRKATGVAASAFETTGHVPIELARTAWGAASRLSGDPDLGLHAAEEFGRGAFGAVELMIRHSATAGLALARFVRFLSIVNGAGAGRLEVRGRTVHVVHQTLDGARASTDLMIAMIASGARGWNGSALAPLWIAKVHEKPADTSEYERLLGAPVRFGARETEIVFDREILDVPANSGDPALGDLLERLLLRSPHAALLAERRAADRSTRSPLPPTSMGVSAEARLAVRICVEQGDARVDHVAHVMGLSARSLQRHLRREGLTLRRLVDEVRMSLVEAHLGHVSKASAAAAVGYSERRALTRAQRRLRPLGLPR